MRRWGIAMLMAAALAALGWLGWSSLDGIYLNQRAALKQRIGQLTNNIRRYEAGIEDQTRVAAALGRYADGSMGGDLETVDHQLRSRLNRIGEEVGMAGLTVGTGRARNLQSPAKSQFRLRGQRALRDETDFVEVEAWMSGQASFEQVLKLVHRVREEPWLKRIHQVRLEPKDNGQRFEVSLRLLTLYLPGQVPQELVSRGYDSTGFDRYAGLIARNPFRIPPLPTPAASPGGIIPAVRTTFPYAQWFLTGVALGPEGAEVWLLNRNSGESRRLAVGETLQELVLVAATGEVAEFRLNDEHFTVSIGHRLVAKTPLGN